MLLAGKVQKKFIETIPKEQKKPFGIVPKSWETQGILFSLCINLLNKESFKKLHNEKEKRCFQNHFSS